LDASNAFFPCATLAWSIQHMCAIQTKHAMDAFLYLFMLFKELSVRFKRVFARSSFDLIDGLI
jgi:hypothetical protein